jgi:nascent polypeptide-associated complex subunit alpha
MLPGLGKINPKQMQAMMKQMGINQEEVDAKRVIIEKEDSKIVIENPNVQKITMQGQESWQITGDAREESSINEEDIRLVMEKTNVSKEKARKALEKSNGDIAEAIMELSG